MTSVKIIDNIQWNIVQCIKKTLILILTKKYLNAITVIYYLLNRNNY